MPVKGDLNRDGLAAAFLSTSSTVAQDKLILANWSLTKVIEGCLLRSWVTLRGGGGVDVVRGGAQVIESYWEEGRSVWRTRARENCEKSFFGIILKIYSLPF